MTDNPVAPLPDADDDTEPEPLLELADDLTTAVVVVDVVEVVDDVDVVDVVDVVTCGRVVVVVVELVVVVDEEGGGPAATTVHLMPDGTSAGSAVNVNWTVQYLSSCVADAAPLMQAIPRL